MFVFARKMHKTKKRIAKLFKFLKITRLPYLPFILGIEPGNICNLRCPLCPTGAGSNEAKKGFMEFELYKKIFDQLKNSLVTVNLYNWGEPLLNKDLFKIIKYIKDFKRSIFVVTSTNLNIDNKKVLVELLKSGIDEIIVSCDGASKETYEKYRVGGDFNLVMENLRFLSDEKRKLNSNADIVWNFLVFKHNEHEITLARSMAEKLGVSFRIGLMRTSMKDEVLKPHQEGIKKDLDWIPDNPQYSAYDKAKLTTKKIIKFCRKPWQEISINWNGEVFPCCAVYGDNFNFGDTNRDSIKDIWNNQKYRQARREIIGCKQAASTICGICKSNGFMHM